MSVDPLAEQTMEPYIYCGNNPINFIDLDGNFRLPANTKREQRRLCTAPIKTIKAVFRDSEFREAFKVRFKEYDKVIRKMLKDGDEPTVIMNESLLDLASFDPGGDSNLIKIDSGIVNTALKNKEIKSISNRDIISEKFDRFRRNNAAKDFRQQREIMDLKSQKMPSNLDIYKKPKIICE